MLSIALVSATIVFFKKVFFVLVKNLERHTVTVLVAQTGGGTFVNHISHSSNIVLYDFLSRGLS